MNKEIKFRAWDKDLEQFVKNPKDFGVCGMGLFTRSSYKGSVHNLVLMQYTGLKDKNGKEIYFEDFVKDSRGFIGRVIMKDNWYITVEGFVRSSFDQPDAAFSEDEEWEVVGSVYKNPELLK